MKVPLEYLPKYAREFVEVLPKEVPQTAYVVGLIGELGAGKTAFVQEVAKALGITANVASPTFTLLKTYPTIRHPFAKLVHIDAYRLHPGDTDTIGWGDYYKDPSNLILVEWPERLPGGMPKGVRSLEFGVVSENEREITEKIA